MGIKVLGFYIKKESNLNDGHGFHGIRVSGIWIHGHDLNGIGISDIWFMDIDFMESGLQIMFPKGIKG